MCAKKIHSLTEGITTADRFAVLGTQEKFRRHQHAWKVWRTLKEFRCVAYAVASGLEQLEGSKVYPHLSALKGVDVVVPCLLPEEYPQLPEDAAAAGAKVIWFQEQTWSPELEEKCAKLGITSVRGCVLRHKVYPRPLGWLNPCYWHGRNDSKVGRWGGIR